MLVAPLRQCSAVQVSLLFRQVQAGCVGVQLGPIAVPRLWGGLAVWEGDDHTSKHQPAVSAEQGVEEWEKRRSFCLERCSDLRHLHVQPPPAPQHNLCETLLPALQPVAHSFCGSSVQQQL
eukprot:CAMPEP_0175160046 /NCGR_PEP_ID=MMETSP0087-20121206/23780_1 /TAXON_ID=136419 /ORGANISM="Unknown Unknown, Strain D1" /LENGTH=120 /DNA_ID=CAMNT_0016448203 /DNA_START=677 /DNA_END=1039 /DNA_ORIENTATION=-